MQVRLLGPVDVVVDGEPRLVAGLRRQTAILRQDPELDLAAPAVTLPATRPGTPVPAQLPSAVPAFAGRLAELARLDALLPQTGAAASSAPAAVISAVSGTAGVGKTALAVHWAHRVAARFPDGQLYVNLRGFDPAGQALEPGAAMQGFLAALGVPADGIPAELPAQAGLYRSLLAACTAALLLEPSLAPIIPVPPRPGVVLAGTATAEEALSWFTAEHAALVAGVPMAAGAGFGTHAWQLAWALTTFLLRLGRWDDQLLVQDIALAAAGRSNDLAGQAHARHGIALAYARSGQFSEAGPHFRDALRRFGMLGDQVSQARIHSSLTWLAERAERPADALRHSLLALELYRAGNHAAMLPTALNDVGYCHALLGHYQQAIAYCEQALAANQALGERSGESDTWDSLGYIHLQLGDCQQAVRCYERSLSLCRELTDRYNEADTLDHIGDAHCGMEDLDAARRAWQQAARIFGDLDHPDSERVRAKLRAHSGPSAWISLTPHGGSQAALRPCG